MSNSNPTHGGRGRRFVFFTENGSANTSIVGTGAITTASSGGSNVWASVEAKDTFAALGAVNTAGEWHSTEVKDTFAAAGSAPLSGTLAATDAKDGFHAVGFLPIHGTMSVTEYGDSWANSSGFEPFGFENVSTANDGGSSFTVTTLGPDRLIVLLYASIGPSHSFNDITSIDGPLTWYTEALAFGVLPGGEFADGMSLQIMYAHAHDKLTSQTFNVTAEGGVINVGMLHCAMKGLNGNFRNPWLRVPLTPSIGFDAFNDTDTPKLPSIIPFGTGFNPTTPEKFPSVVFSVAMQDDGGGSGPDTFTPPFHLLKTAAFAGVQRNGTISLAAQYQDYSMPWQDTDSTYVGINWSENHTSFLVIGDALVVTPPPNRLVAQEGADGMRAFGYPGSSPGPFGFIDAHEAQDTFHAVGYQPVSGTLTVTEAKDTFSAFIKVPITGTLHATEAKDRLVAAGIGLGEDGTWTSTESVDMVNVTGYTPVSGTFNTTEATDRARFISGGVVNQRKRRTFYVT